MGTNSSDARAKARAELKKAMPPHKPELAEVDALVVAINADNRQAETAKPKYPKGEGVIEPMPED